VQEKMTAIHGGKSMQNAVRKKLAIRLKAERKRACE
jgi:hypothetical protein